MRLLSARARQQRGLALLAIGIGEACVDRAHLGALLLLEEAHAFGAAAGVDHMELLAGPNGLVGADRDASATARAVLHDDGRHPWMLAIRPLSRKRETTSPWGSC